MPQTGPVLITRRNLLLAAAATVAACSAKRDLGGTSSIDNSADPLDAGQIDAGPTAGSQIDAGPTAGGQIDAGPALSVPNPAVDKVPASVVMVGDSISALSQVALDSVLTGIGFGTVTINAEPRRRIEVGEKKPTNGVDIVTFVAGADPPKMWVIELGTNDAGLYETDEEYQGLIDSLLEVIGVDAPLVWVDTYREDHLDGCVQFNDLLRSTLDDRGNATVAGWYQQCIASASDILTEDGVHPNENGVLVFADTVRAAIATRLE